MANENNWILPDGGDPSCPGTEPMADERKIEAAFYPVGNIKGVGQIIAELKIGGERMEIQAGVMKEWSERFHAFAAALAAAGRVAPSPELQELKRLLDLHMPAAGRVAISMADERELLPCPFCGREPPIEKTGFHLNGRTIRCETDDCMGPHTTAASMEDATAQWNRRAPVTTPDGAGD